VTDAAGAIGATLLDAAEITTRRVDDVNAVLDVPDELEDTALFAVAAVRGARGAPCLQRTGSPSSRCRISPIAAARRWSSSRWRSCWFLRRCSAWTPAPTSFWRGALRNLGLIPLHIAELLSAYPADFLYGSIAADTSIAKKYAEVGRHCHSWHIGMEIHDDARTPQLRAFALGYLAHLAADVVAHNFFVPRQLAVTSSTTAVGHSYWESRIDTHIGDPWPRRARELLLWITVSLTSIWIAS
jgi:hypothetical protein